MPDPTTVNGQFFWCEQSQGTAWIWGSIGGTYYPSGTYYSNGVSWTYLKSPQQATQSEVDAGVNNDKFVTPNTLTNFSKWLNYVPTTTTVNSKALSSNITLTTADISDSTNKRYQTDAQNTYNDATSSIQTQLDSKVPTTRTVNTKALSSNVTLTTADIADSTNKRYQTDNQNTYNDATSSIQTQLNNRLLGVHTIRKPYTGQKIYPHVSATALTVSNGSINRLTAIPYIPNISFTSSDLFTNITIGVASSNARILIYSDLNFAPDQKLYESANLDCSTTGIKTATTSFSFMAGTIYWLCVHSSSTQTFSSPSLSSLMPIGVGAAATTIYNSVTVSFTFGSAPTTFGTPGYNASALPYLIGITPA